MRKTSQIILGTIKRIHQIDECSKILDEYIESLISLNEPKTNEQILQCVEIVIVKLNRLNEKCNYSLIETDQREDLVPYILSAAALAGLSSENNDITEN